MLRICFLHRMRPGYGTDRKVIYPRSSPKSKFGNQARVSLAPEPTVFLTVPPCQKSLSLADVKPASLFSIESALAPELTRHTSFFFCVTALGAVGTHPARSPVANVSGEKEPNVTQWGRVERLWGLQVAVEEHGQDQARGAGLEAGKPFLLLTLWLLFPQKWSALNQ